jgi:hypothetical protein
VDLTFFSSVIDAVTDGYDINRRSNLIDLPRDVTDSFTNGEPYHNGGHLDAYYDHVERRLQTLEAQYNAGVVNRPNLRAELARVEQDLRDDLTVHRTVRLTLLTPNNGARLCKKQVAPDYMRNLVVWLARRT